MPAFTLSVVGNAAAGPALDPDAGGFEAAASSSLAEAARRDATLLITETADEFKQLVRREGLSQAAYDCAVVVWSTTDDAQTEIALMQLGVQAVIGPGLPAERLLRQAVERKRIEIAARRAYATDLATGLPHETQLIEHLSQLLALRAREPRPMALLVLRVQGFAAAAGRLGPEAANILRRKVAVRLRGGLRASDVVAAVGSDAFGIVLGRMEVPADAERVAGKLVRALQQPFNVAGQGHAVAVTIGMALFPEHGNDAAALLRRAAMQAAAAGVGIDGQAVRIGRAGAANDEP